jgi:hypothetical protein
MLKQSQTFAGNTLGSCLVFPKLGYFEQAAVSCSTKLKLVSLSNGKRFVRAIPAGRTLSFSVIEAEVKLILNQKSTLTAPHFEIYSQWGGWFSKSPRGLIQFGGRGYPYSLSISVQDRKLLITNGVTINEFLYASLAQQLLQYPFAWQVEFLQGHQAAVEALKVVAIICRSALWKRETPPYGSSHALPPIVITAVNSTDGKVLSTNCNPLTTFDAIQQSVTALEFYELTEIFQLAQNGLQAEQILQQLYPKLFVATLALD